ncbi:uncharacterized protein O3Q21_013082 [Podargus strigoides]
MKTPNPPQPPNSNETPNPSPPAGLPPPIREAEAGADRDCRAPPPATGEGKGGRVRVRVRERAAPPGRERRERRWGRGAEHHAGTIAAAAAARQQAQGLIYESCPDWSQGAFCPDNNFQRCQDEMGLRFLRPNGRFAAKIRRLGGGDTSSNGGATGIGGDGTGIRSNTLIPAGNASGGEGPEAANVPAAGAVSSATISCTIERFCLGCKEPPCHFAAWESFRGEIQERFKCGMEDDSMTMFFEKMGTKSPQDDAKVLMGHAPNLQPRDPFYFFYGGQSSAVLATSPSKQELIISFYPRVHCQYLAQVASPDVIGSDFPSGMNLRNSIFEAQPVLVNRLCVSSQDVADKTTASSGESGQTRTTIDNSKMQGTTSTSSPGNPTPTSATVQGTTSTSKLGNLPLPPTTSPATVQGTTSINNPGRPPPVTTTSPHQSQQVSSSTSSRASIVTPAAISSTTQLKTSPPAGLGSLAATTAANSVLTHSSRPPATPGGLGTSVSSPASVKAQGSQPSDQLTSPAASTRVPTSSLTPGLKDYSVSSPTSVTKHSHSSPSSPVQGLASSTRSGSINTSVTPSGGSTSPTTSKASLSLPSGSINKVSEAATTPTLGADQRSHGAGSVSTKPASADQSPASTQPSAPIPGDQTVSSSPSHQHTCSSFQNEVICKDQVQNNWPTIYLKEAKTCAEWRTTINNSFFESFCSTGQHTFNASRETCTVTLTSHEPRSQHWVVQVVVHLPLDPGKVLKEMKEKKDKLEELGIANVTYEKMEREMIINDEFSTPLIITIVTLAGSLLLIAAIYGCCHQRFSQKKDQHIHPILPGFDDGHVALIFNQRLTEELQTMENGYHDNSTLEVMETSSEMQEKVNLNGELRDSWIVPLDTLMKEDLEEEEDTHL